MTTYVLDACALIALLRNEPGCEEVRSLLVDSDTLCFIHAVNLCEVYYDCLRSYDETQAEQMLIDLSGCGLLLREDMDAGFWKKAGQLKAQGRISLADAFAVTLAEREKAILITSDHHEFDPLLAAGVLSVLVRFIR